MADRWIALAASIFVLVVSAAKAVEPSAEESAGAKPKGRYLRLVRDDAGSPVALEVAIVRFVPRDCGRTSPTVDLVGAVHVADKAYYEQLNREFQKYEAVLYELVAPEGAKVPEGGGGGSRSMISLIQNAMKDVLKLEFQLNAIHYNRPNMIHADMSPQQFAESMRQRGESVFGMFLRIMGYALSRQAEEPQRLSEADLLLALLDRNRALAMKRVLAEQFEDLEGSLTAIGGPEGSTIIHQRNKVALEVLRKQLAAGKQQVALFYGAGHFADLEQRLRDDFDLVPIHTRWLVAWNLKEAPRPKASGAAAAGARTQ